MKMKSESEVAQSYPTLRDPIDCSLPSSSVHGIFQARVLEWGAIAFSGKNPSEFQNKLSSPEATVYDSANAMRGHISSLDPGDLVKVISLLWAQSPHL